MDSIVQEERQITPQTKLLPIPIIRDNYLSKNIRDYLCSTVKANNVEAWTSNTLEMDKLITHLIAHGTTQTGYKTTPIGCKRGSRYVERYWALAYLKIKMLASWFFFYGL